jgi:hypothetical protein
MSCVGETDIALIIYGGRSYIPDPVMTAPSDLTSEFLMYLAISKDTLLGLPYYVLRIGFATS